MSVISKIKRIVLLKSFAVLRRSHLFKHLKLTKIKPLNNSFKLVYFCGKDGVNYLNASLYSVYKNWDALPEILIITDGTPASMIEKNILKWPQKMDIIEWSICADYFRGKNNQNLYNYANKELWGKKFVAVLYCSEHFPTLYSDTDILWFSDPKSIETSTYPILKMGLDIELSFSTEMGQTLNEENALLNRPLNAGLIYAHGDFSSYPKWNELCNYLSEKPDNRTEQTAFAILNNYFNPDIFWSFDEVLIKLDDSNSLKSTIKHYPGIMARHYVSVKNPTFWRDSVYVLFKKTLF